MIRLLLSLLAVLLSWASAEAQVERHTTSTARGAAGTTCSAGVPCTNTYALSQSSAGDIVSLEGNTMASPYSYLGANDMIAPPANIINGTSGAKITVRCKVAGGCLIDGEFVRRPLNLIGNSWFLIEDINFRNGSALGLLSLTGGSNNNVIRRFVAWDLPINANVAGTNNHANSNNTFEDCGIFGVSRKSAGSGQSSSNTTIRRCWFRWEGEIFGGPLGLTMFYNSQNATIENVLVTWSGESMPNNFISNDGTAMTNFNPRGPAGILGNDRIDCGFDLVNPPCPPKEANLNLRGAIVYTKVTDRIPTNAVGGAPGAKFPRFWSYGASDLTISDLVSVMANTHARFDDLFGYGLTRTPQNTATMGGGDATVPIVGNSLTRVTSVRGVAGDTAHADWTVTGTSTGNCVTGASGNACAGGTTTAVQTPWQNTSTNGARACYQTVDGVTGTTPLWPFPMNDRIMAATAMAGAYGAGYSFATIGCNTAGGATNCKNADGTAFTFPARTETDVTADIEALLGTIPAECRTGAVPPPFPASTGFPATTVSNF